MSLPLVDGILNLGTAIVEHLNIKAAQKPVERIREKKLDILEERRKGDKADQAKIAALYKELEVEIESLAQLVTISAKQ